MNFDKPFWKSLFRDVDGTASSSRVLTALVTVTTLFWVTFVTLKHAQIPELHPVETFLCSVIMSLYGVSRISQALTAITSKDKPCDK